MHYSCHFRDKEVKSLRIYAVIPKKQQNRDFQNLKFQITALSTHYCCPEEEKK